MPASVFRYPLNVRHPAPLNALRAEIGRRRAAGARRIGLIGGTDIFLTDNLNAVAWSVFID